MDRTTGANYDESSGYRRFTDGPPGTTVEENFMNNIQEEICHICESTAQTLSSSDRTQVMQTVGMMGFGMRNGQIVPSTAGNNLTVAIKTMNNLDPTTLNPVYVRIGNYLRKISSALYITLTGGTDDWDRTSFTYSLFVYLGWDATNSRVEILLCPQPTYTAYPVANPALLDPRRLRSAYGSNTGTAIVSGHAMQVIGRIDSVVQSAADNYTSVSSTAISHPIYYTPKLTAPIVPLKVLPGDTTPDFSTNNFDYVLVHNILYFDCYYTGDGGTDGVGAGNMKLDLPFIPYITTLQSNFSWWVKGANFNSGPDTVGLVQNTAGNKYYYLYGLIHGGGGFNESDTINPGSFTNGDRYIKGNMATPILI